jgi:hypothetical protein
MNPRLIIFIGLFVVLIGVILYLFPDAFKWFGNLPGDFKSENDNIKFYFPLTSMIIISVVLNIILKLYRYLG